MANNYNGPDNIPDLDPEMISQILTNVYDACEAEPSEVPIESLISYSSYRQERHVFQKVLVIAALIVFILLPFLFVSPKFEITQAGNIGQPKYIIDVDTFIPVNVVSATMEDGSNLVVYESGIHEYTVQPAKNGKIDINVILANRQYQKGTIEVDELDTTAPHITSHKTENDIVYIYVDDDGSGIDYDKVYGMSASGDTVQPLDYSGKGKYVAFAYPEESLTVYIPDMAGNMLNLLVSP